MWEGYYVAGEKCSQYKVGPLASFNNIGEEEGFGRGFLLHLYTINAKFVGLRAKEYSILSTFLQETIS